MIKARMQPRTVGSKEEFMGPVAKQNDCILVCIFLKHSLASTSISQLLKVFLNTIPAWCVLNRAREASAPETTRQTEYRTLFSLEI